MLGIAFTAPTSPGVQPQTHNEFLKITHASKGLEHLFHLLFEHHPNRIVDCFRSTEDGEDCLVLQLSEKFNDNSPIAFISIPSTALPSFRPLNEECYPLADMEGYTVNDEWFDKRNDRLRIRVDSYKGEILAPPTAISELILSYTHSDIGTAKVSQKIIEIQRGVPFALRIELSHASQKVECMWTEVVHVPMPKLRALLERRGWVEKRNYGPV